MRSFLKTVGTILFSTLVLFILLEILFRFIGASGGSRFMEKEVIREHLSPHKPKDEVRIFAYGESTMHGSHYGPTSSPARWLEAYLKDVLPGKNIRVINFARIGHGTEFTYETFRDSLVYKPDLAIFYVGHNDFLPGNRKDDVLAEERLPSSTFRTLVRRSYFLSTLLRWVLEKRMAAKQDRSDDQMERETIEIPLNDRGSENITPWTEPFYWENIAFFESILSKILKTAADHRVPVLFMNPVSNLKDFAPFQSRHLKKLSKRGLNDWEGFFASGKALETSGDLLGAANFYEKAYAVDPTYADLDFRLGRICLGRGELDRARKLFEQARDNDVEIWRATKDILAVLQELKKTKGLQLIDTEKAVIQEAPGGILGEPVIEDNVHFSLKGHALVGRLMAEEIYKRNLLFLREDWQWDNIRGFDTVAKELGIDDQLLLSADLKMVSYFGDRLDNRIRFAKKALEIDPQNSRALRYLAWTYWLMGRKDTAIALYQYLEQKDPKALEEAFKAQPVLRAAVQGS